MNDTQSPPFIASTAPHAVLPLLAEPSSYVACQWDLTADAARRGYWLNLYREHFPGLLDEAVRVEAHDGGDESDARQRAEACRDAFFARLDELDATPGKFGRLDILAIGAMREAYLREHGFADPYRLIKRQENDTAMKLLPALLRELDAMADGRRAAALIEGAFAGNIFDVGATETLALFQSGKLDFHATRAKLKPRPWLFDDLDVWLERWRVGPHRAALIFVDNAGCDVVLGMLPLAREMLKRGTRVILAANSTPALNDVTLDELNPLLAEAAALDEMLAAALRDGRLETVASGCGTPLIDLSRVAPQLAELVTQRGVDLVVLQGMGRAIESNLHARFTCDVLKMGMVKDPNVADAVGGAMYDLVMRFEAGA